jgi:8-amino-7-oxononanoate synthase
VRPDWVSRLERKAGLRAAAGLRRSAAARSDGVVDLAGNDYLGLSRHPDVIAAARRALMEYGLGATGSRVVRGGTTEHALLERELAAHLGWPAALVYSSGYLANVGAIAGLCRPGTLLVLDAHAHASLIDGCRLAATAAHAAVVTVAHGDVSAFAATLEAHCGGPAVVITESVYSVDGDLAPLAELYDCCQCYGAVLLVDDAHGLGVLGQDGAGGANGAGIVGRPDLVVTTTLSKAVGASGGAVAGPPELIRHLVDTGRTFVYDTALPPAVAAGARAGLRLLREAEDARALLRRRAEWTARELRAGEISVPEPAGSILSARATSANAATAWAAACRDAGVDVGCFRPPSTPDGTSRLRITLNAGIGDDDFAAALRTIVRIAPTTTGMAEEPK